MLVSTIYRSRFCSSKNEPESLPQVDNFQLVEESFEVDGVVSTRIVKTPYKPIDPLIKASDYSLSASLKSGMNLSPCPSLRSGSLSENDKVLSEVEKRLNEQTKNE